MEGKFEQNNEKIFYVLIPEKELKKQSDRLFSAPTFFLWYWQKKKNKQARIFPE